MITQTIHVGDCELLEHYFDATDGDNPRWRDVEERELVEGLNAERAPRNVSSGEANQWNLIYGLLYPSIGATPPATQPGAPAPGLTECRSAWYGLTPLVLNPTFTDVDDIDKLAEGTEGVEWTHAGDAVNVYGTDPATGYARNPWDNVGVQYGLDAVADGEITPEEFLDLNAQVGSWKEPEDMVEEGCPFIQSKCGTVAEHDPWSSRQMNLSPDGGVTPAPRREGDVIAMRRRLREGDGVPGRGRHPVHRLAALPRGGARHAQLVAVVRDAAAHPTRAGRRPRQPGDLDDRRPARRGVRPDAAGAGGPPRVDHQHPGAPRRPASGPTGPRPRWTPASPPTAPSCTRAADVWDGVLDERSRRAVHRGHDAPLDARGGSPGRRSPASVFKCQTKSVAEAVADGDYGAWMPTAAQVDRLEVVFPEGVCDYSHGDLGDPRVEEAVPENEAFARRA